MNFILIGFKNSGKTTVGKSLAEKIHYSFVDIDHILKDLYQQQQTASLSVPEIYQALGEEGFRDLEYQALKSIQAITRTIISTGGGCVLREKNRALFKELGKTIYLQASKEELIRRQHKIHIPAFLDKEKHQDSFNHMYDIRKPLYESIADYTVDIDNKHAPAVVNSIMQQLGEKYHG